MPNDVVAPATMVCPTCGTRDELDVETTQLPTGARVMQREPSIVFGCSGCGFSAEKTPSDFVVLDRGTREVGFDKREYRRRLAVLARVAVAA